MTRAKNLSTVDIEAIVKILDGWSGKLTWDLLIKAIARRSKAVYTRQALNNHERIKNAFALRKSAVTGKPGSSDIKGGSSSELQAALERIARLEGENQRLRMENNRFMEKFATWAYNAHSRGLNEAFLSQPLPIVNREVTK
ncbi:hypothetical protein GTP23_21355 [Pseudoduganella sp. FT93W]|uniref:Uncharacterized protein n=1 Tax=Duganella fentianensis TaxID=2692177 RepID=A0A845I6F2_9BURK|nr:hypothetical protein [Duganella fentianensis]MYN47596.1 hypothetical protein [Duganella fentianensis]